MRQAWEPEELVADWTLVERDERELVAYKRGATRLGFTLLFVSAPMTGSSDCGSAVGCTDRPGSD